ncbi:hypothetical protein [Hymenobacter siberiensis]|uniref:hypothetical protein n=1 Tax=Hymenobacter siberiensis TaxID=2848396 RepID=UPI001C1E4CE0|nr:hypothetical protein [Hymenobacter siberiensis]
MKKNLKNLERIMYGHNYEVHFGVEFIDNCETLNEVCNKLCIKYADTRFCEIQPESINETFLWESIRYGFAYRGDNAAGLVLNDETEKKLLAESKKYESFLRQYLTNTTEILRYAEDSGVPYMFVFWGYSFVLFNPNRESLFIYGLSSD